MDDFSPTALLSVEYPNGNAVLVGNTLSPDCAQDVPEIQITPDGADTNGDDIYTVVWRHGSGGSGAVANRNDAQVLTDPDAPSRDDPKWSEFCHWIVTGLKAASIEDIAMAQSAEASTIDTSKGRHVIEYMGPAPPPETGKHRYVFLLYKNGNTVDMEGPSARKRWGNEDSRQGARKWAKKYDLELVGMGCCSVAIQQLLLTCVGANFFFAQNKSQ